MQSSRAASFICTECNGSMEPVEGVPVLTSLVGHAVYGCGCCGHVLLVQEDAGREWTAGWISLGSAEITCVSMAS